MNKRFACWLLWTLSSSVVGLAQEMENTFALENVQVLSRENRYAEFFVSPKFDKVLFQGHSKEFALADTLMVNNSLETSTPLAAKTLWMDKSNLLAIKGFDPIWSQDNKTVYFIKRDSNSC